ncbi:MAG: SPFH domain-containing protein [Kofleriaceae bacterium]|nr:SPFH domain-containing protein [Myxococcales bacterium]MCB9562911.1 SPFH domain-containing protein [Kofleriaceae bacterium]MCB9572712.1 SPFH domain-containing protein [Kofleriaceae bacterium]
MLGIAYLKTPPTTYVLHYKAGRVKREGGGLSFLYYRPTSTVVLIPVGSADVPFVFSEVTADFQEVTIQGQLTYRIADPRKLAGLLDYSVDAAGRYRSEDPGKLEERLVHATQVLARDVIGKLSLRDALAASEALVREITAGLRAAEVLTMAGVEPLDVSILSIRPTPEMARALEAEAREQLQREADESIYARRNAAVEQERIIKESELETELAVEAKQREIRERKMAAEIALEEQRTTLIGRKVENDKQDADGRAYAIDATLRPFKEADWKTLMAMSAGGGDPRTMIALAFRELAENATKIGELNVSPDLLRSLLGK